MTNELEKLKKTITATNELEKLEAAKLEKVKKLFRDKDNGNKEYPLDVYERIMDMAITSGIDAVPAMIEILSFKKKDGGRSYTPMRTIAALRLIAQNTGTWAGNDSVVWSEDPLELFGKRYPNWGQMTIYKIVQGQRCAFVSPKLYAKETVQSRSLWESKGLFMFEKNIEAAALRRAFPGILEDLYIPEEGFVPGAEEGKVNTSGMDALSGVKAAVVSTDKETGEVTISAGLVTEEVYAEAIQATVDSIIEPLRESIVFKPNFALLQTMEPIAETIALEPVIKEPTPDLETLKPTMTADDLMNWLNQIRECTNQKQLDEVAAMVKDIYLLSSTDKKNLNEAVKTTKIKIKGNK